MKWLEAEGDVWINADHIKFLWVYMSEDQNYYTIKANLGSSDITVEIGKGNKEFAQTRVKHITIDLRAR